MADDGITIYLLDSNVLMTAHRAYYGLDLCPGFWNAIKAGHNAGNVLSTRRVFEEINRNNDLLSEWVSKELPSDFFIEERGGFVLEEFRAMMKWVQSQDYSPAARAKFADDTDGWLVAVAKAFGYRLVTLEGRHDDAKSRVPIPNLCLEFGVEYCDTFQMLRELNCRFE